MPAGNFNRLVRTARLGILLTGMTLLASGCSYSGDRHIYESTAWYPQTVTLVDTRTGEDIWAVDVPVGKQLIVGFRGGAGPNDHKPDVMYWSVTDLGRKSTNDKSEMPVPGPDARVLVPTRRASPETPDSSMPGSPFPKTEDEYAPAGDYYGGGMDGEG